MTFRTPPVVARRSPSTAVSSNTTGNHNTADGAAGCVAFQRFSSVRRVAVTDCVAEEVEKVNPDLVVRGEDGKAYSVRYDAVNAMLLNEFLKEHRKVEQLEKQMKAVTAALQK